MYCKYKGMDIFKYFGEKLNTLDHCHELLYNNVEEMDRNTSI